MVGILDPCEGLLWPMELERDGFGSPRDPIEYAVGSHDGYEPGVLGYDPGSISTGCGG